MEETYERQLADIVAAMPRRPCVVALVPTIPLDQAAALASDIAQSVGAAQSGHTILTSFEASPARLDHEIGLEDGHGLTDVLSQRAAMSEVAAHGKARRFIYVPVGASGAAGESLLRSPAWRALSRSALRGGGNVLAFVPGDVFEATVGASHNGSPERGRLFDALIWLGPARGPGQDIRDAASASGALELGSLQLPGSSAASAPRTALDAPAEPAPVAVAAGASAQASAGPPAAASAVASEGTRSPASTGTPVPGRFGRRRTARRQVRRRGLFLLLILLGILGATTVYFVVATSPSGGETAAPQSPDQP